MFQVCSLLVCRWDSDDWGVQVGKCGCMLVHRCHHQLECQFFGHTTAQCSPKEWWKMRDVGLAGRGEHAKCRRKGGDRRNNRHQSGSSGAAAGRTLSPESLDTAAGLCWIFQTLLYLTITMEDTLGPIEVLCFGRFINKSKNWRTVGNFNVDTL